MRWTSRCAGAAVLAAIAVTGLAGCGVVPGSGGPAPTEPGIPGFDAVKPTERAAIPRSIAMGASGQGMERVYVMRHADAVGRQPLVIFFHGYGTETVASEEPWMTHLARRATVAWPVYNEPPFDARRGGEKMFPAAARGLRMTIRRLRAYKLIRPKDVVVAGYSLGGSLARDYAVAARRSGLPVPRALYAVFPGRGLCDEPTRLPPQPGEFEAGTWILVLASNNDLLAGTCGGREIVREAVEVPDSRKQLRLIRDFEVGDHFAPTRSSRKEKKTFWQPLDRIVAEGPPRGAASAPVGQRHETS